MAREIADWKSKLHTRFASLRLLNFVVEGFRGDMIHVDDTLSVTVNIDAGKMNPEEIRVEMIISKKGADAEHDRLTYVPLSMEPEGNHSSLIFSARYTVTENGSYYYGVRVMPYHPLLSSKVEGDLVFWG
jgi:starch phosphorylase